MMIWGRPLFKKPTMRGPSEAATLRAAILTCNSWPLTRPRDWGAAGGDLQRRSTLGSWWDVSGGQRAPAMSSQSTLPQMPGAMQLCWVSKLIMMIMETVIVMKAHGHLRNYMTISYVIGGYCGLLVLRRKSATSSSYELIMSKKTWCVIKTTLGV